MRIVKAVLINALGSAISILTPLFAIPLYVNLLSPVQWGIASFVLTLQILAAVLEAGLAQALTREFANLADKSKSLSTVFSKTLRLYAFSAVAVGLLLAVCSPLLTNHLRLAESERGVAALAVLLASVIVSSQLMSSVYKSVLTGTERHATFNGVQSISVVFRHGAAVIALLFYPSAVTFTIVHGLGGLFDVFIKHALVSQFLKTGPNLQARNKDATGLSTRHDCTWSDESVLFAKKMAIGVAAGALAINLDKIHIAYMLSVEEVGKYAVASTLAIGISAVLSPLSHAFLPRLTRSMSNKDEHRRVARQLTFLCIGIASILILSLPHSNTLIRIWLGARGDINVAEIYVALLVGTIANVLYFPMYLESISKLNAQPILAANSLTLILSILLLPTAVSYAGPVGATFPWILINALGIFFCKLLKMKE